MKTIVLLLMLFPLAGALFLAVRGGRASRLLAETVACSAISGSLIMAAAAVFIAGRLEHDFVLFPWFAAGDFVATMDVHYDALAGLMALMITFVGGLIHFYSVFYMRGDEGYVRYFCYLNLFVFFMLIIVLADNLVFLFLGWEGVGFCSYALIGFWYEEEANGAAGRKAFLLTRIGDVGLVIAIGLLFANCHSLSLAGINARAGLLSGPIALLAGGLLLWSATGKSAQLPLLVWLPDAMAGPTPVSALIHAATMVTAGVYLLMRFFPLLAVSQLLLQAIAIVGTLTALYGACAALVQKDIKRVLAYSTISQMGYLFLAIGVGDVLGSMFHLLTHAFFKSLLFLAAGCIIQALQGEHDIFRMGEPVRRRLPAVFLLFLAGSLALGSVPPTAGFFSKGRILFATIQQPTGIYKALWVTATITAFLTTLYIFRLFLLAFTGRPGHERIPSFVPVPKPMVWVLWPLALLSLTAGLLNLPELQAGGGWLTRYLAAIPGAMPALPAATSLQREVETIDALLAIIGMILAYLLYGPGRRRGLPSLTGLHNLLFSGFGLDRLYEAIFGRPYRKMARFLWNSFDEAVLDRGIVCGAGFFPQMASGLRHWTTGRISTSLKMLLLGFTVILIFLAV